MSPATPAAEWPSPVLGKRVSPPGSPDSKREYLPITWDFLLRLRAWARWLAVHTGAHVYLVGSALDHDSPRDVDVAVVWPRERYEEHFGPIPRTEEEIEARWQTNFCEARHSFVVSAWHGVGYKPYIDVHLCPDVWYADRPRLLLGTPDDADAPQGWQGEEPFILRTVVRHDPDEVLFEWPAKWEGDA